MANIVELTKENFEQEVMNSDMPVFVDFWASWCGPCRLVAPIVDELADDYAGKIKVCKVDVDAQQELAASHGVMTIPTLMLVKNGTVVFRESGARPKDALEQIIIANI